MDDPDDGRPGTGAPAGPGRGPGLRERKKHRTRQAIQHHALRLFTEQGYEATTVEQIADAADVSPSTFFRYYPSKEDVILQDEYDPLWRAALIARPADEPPLEAVMNSLLGLLPEVLSHEGIDIRSRLRLTLEVPALRGRIIQNTAESTAVLAEALAIRAGRDEPDYEDRVLAAACVGVCVVAILDWAKAPEQDAEPLVRRAFAVIDTGATTR
ncbi:MAG: TetR family transcriptional regulator [Actinocatenispora sp.]